MAQVKFEDLTTATFNAPAGTFVYRERVQRSLKMFGLFLLAAVFSILLPLVHFVLVPTFLLLAIIVGWMIFNQTSYVDLTNCKCPKCSAPLKEKKVFQSKSQEFSKIYCFACRTNMKVKA